MTLLHKGAKQENMRNSCSDNVYYKKKKLLKEEEDLRDRINDFYSNKSELFEEITHEKHNDPSKEILEVEEEVKNCDPFRGFLVPGDNGSIRKESGLNTDTEEVKAKLCKFFTKGFCKHGSSCSYFHEINDCKDHTENGKC